MGDKQHPTPVRRRARRKARRDLDNNSQEKTATNAAFGIIFTVGGLVIYSAVNEKFKVPAEMWGLATAAAAFLFTVRRPRNNQDDSEEESEGEEESNDDL